MRVIAENVVKEAAALGLATELEEELPADEVDAIVGRTEWDGLDTPALQQSAGDGRNCSCACAGSGSACPRTCAETKRPRLRENRLCQCFAEFQS